MEKKVIKFFQVWKSNQNGWVYQTGGGSPCLSVGAHHGCEPKIVEINETEDSTADKGGLPGGGRARHL